MKPSLKKVLVPTLRVGTDCSRRSASAAGTDSAPEPLQSPAFSLNMRANGRGASEHIGSHAERGNQNIPLVPTLRVGAGAVIALFAIAVLLAAPAAGQTSNPLANTAAAWKPLAAEQIKAQAIACLETPKADAAVRARAEAIWRDLPATATEDDLLIRLAMTYALLDRNAAKLVELCSQPRGQLVLPSQDWLRAAAAPPLLVNNLRLLYARWLVDEALYDEALEQLSGLKPDDVAAPAALLFYQSVVCHALLNKDSGLKSIGELLQGAESSPRRYVVLARLMQEDLKGLQDDTLDHIARRMDDVRRRLDLGRAGKKVRDRQDGIIESLDKLIKKLEEQQQQQANMLQPGSPMPDSKIAGGKGPGKVDRKNIGSDSGWGNLPPKKREEAMQQIGRDFPSHYRDVIEQYFRRLAAEESE
ncbi:MAG: hypothetical protein KKE86_09980 [Planctomycetes bacterium]|nr:hypothetical protein [Planctomycetota bacterium]MBU4399648.1 hypothetical protein [Planctomycetota bacterium]MCG2685490.1 hypothetical protein [Planctomycetales bacterium]